MQTLLQTLQLHKYIQQFSFIGATVHQGIELSDQSFEFAMLCPTSAVCHTRIGGVEI